MGIKDVARLDWDDFLQRHPSGHLVSVVLFPPRAEPHGRRVRYMLEQLIEQRLAGGPFSTTEAALDGLTEIHCGFTNDSDAEALARLVEAAAGEPRSGWSRHRFVELSAAGEVALAGLLAPAD